MAKFKTAIGIVEKKPGGADNMKKKIFTFAVLVICMTMLASGTLAYFTAKGTAHNVITSGSVDIQIEEWQETDEGLEAYPKEVPVKIMPGSIVSKVVTVKSLSAESYIRANYKVIIKDSQNEVMNISTEELSNIISFSMNQTDWKYHEDDGMWYYNDSVEKDDSTAPLFTEVTFSGPNMTNKYQGCTVEIVVNAQAVQTANNGNSAMDAVGW